MTWKKIILVIFGSVLVSFVSYFLFSRFVKKTSEALPAALHVESLSNPLTVALDNNVLGKTPFHSESLKEGSGSFVLSSEENSLQTKINLVSGTLTVVNWGLGPSELFSEGEIIWLEKIKEGSSLVVFGSPEGAEVSFDEELLGTTPLSSEKVVIGDHSVKISKQGYKSRSVKIKVQEGFKLSIKSQLFLIPAITDSPVLPFPSEARITVRDFSASDPLLYSDTRGWVRGLIYFFGKSGVAGSLDKIDYYIDYQGRFFDQGGFKVSENSETTLLEKLVIGYLGRKSDGGVTEEAKESLLSFGEKLLISQKTVEILSTVTGWLRVRSTPSLSGAEVAKVNVGEKVELLDESGSWYQIKLPDGKTGWISAAFAKKL